MANARWGAIALFSMLLHGLGRRRLDNLVREREADLARHRPETVGTHQEDNFPQDTDRTVRGRRTVGTGRKIRDHRHHGKRLILRDRLPLHRVRSRGPKRPVISGLKKERVVSGANASLIIRGSALLPQSRFLPRKKKMNSPTNEIQALNRLRALVCLYTTRCRSLWKNSKMSCDPDT